MIALFLSTLIRTACATTAADIDKSFVDCVQHGADDAQRAACLGIALPAAQAALAEISTRLSSVLNAQAEATGQLFEASHAAYPPSRDADCRLQAHVTESEEAGFRECVYQADKKRLINYERFLHYSVED